MGQFIKGTTLIGALWEGQRLKVGMALNAKAYSVISVGDKPAVLVQRAFSYTGKGVTANIYKNSTWAGGTTDVMYNLNDSAVFSQAGIMLIGDPSVTAVGTQMAATQYFIGNTSAQAKGGTNVGIGGGRLLKPNTNYLLEFTSLDAAQDVTARIELLYGDYDYSYLFE